MQHDAHDARGTRKKREGAADQQTPRAVNAGVSLTVLLVFGVGGGAPARAKRVRAAVCS